MVAFERVDDHTRGSGEFEALYGGQKSKALRRFLKLNRKALNMRCLMPDLPHESKKISVSDVLKRNDLIEQIKRQRRHEDGDTFEHLSRPLSRVIDKMAKDWGKK